MDNVSFNRAEGTTPSIAIIFLGSEFLMRDVRINGGYKTVIKIDGTIGRLYDCTFAICDVALHLFNATNVHVTVSNFWNNNILVLMNRVSDCHIHHNWFERANVSFLLFKHIKGGYFLMFLH